MRVLVSGSAGLIGSALIAALHSEGHSVVPLVRTSQPSVSNGVVWDPPTRGPDPLSLSGIDAVVHLSGEPIASGRWTATRKKRIIDSRVESTRLLAESLAKMETPPSVFLCASAIGFYGDRGEAVMREESPAGNGFLPEVCIKWEAASVSASLKGIRVAHLRIGMVLSPRGGALASMLPPFKLGLGGKLGSGQQYMSWITLDDIVRAMSYILKTPSAYGPLNGSAPLAVTNQEFTQTLGRVLHRPTVFSVPPFALHLLLGDMADELLLASIRVEPKRLTDLGFKFLYPTLEPALRHLLCHSRGRQRESSS